MNSNIFLYVCFIVVFFSFIPNEISLLDEKVRYFYDQVTGLLDGLKLIFLRSEILGRTIVLREPPTILPC